VEPLNLAAALRQVEDYWSPMTVATLNDYDVRLVRVFGEFVRHNHAETDEFFLVLEGELTIHLDGTDIVLHPGELYVVPKGVYHQPTAASETAALLIEPREVVNTGDAGGPLTAPRREL